MKFLSTTFIALLLSTHCIRAYNHPISNSPEEIVQIVLQRLYLIERLHNPINALLHLNVDLSTLHNHLCNDSLFCDFDHLAIKECMYTIKKQGNLKPLGRIWKSFSSYRAIADTLLAQELAKAIYVIARQLCGACQLANQRAESTDTESKDIETIEELLNAIDVYIEQLHPTQKGPTQPAPSHTLPDIHLDVHAEKVVERFYCIQRTTKIKNMIEKIAREYPFLFSNYTVEISDQGVTIDGMLFTHPGIVEKITRIDQDHIPFVGLSHDFERYKYIGDYHFTHGYLLALYSACKHVQKEASPTNITKDSSPDLNTATLEQLLDAIDLIIDTLPDILERYEFNNNEISWKKWLRKYWWAPMFIGASVGLRLWIALQPPAVD
jgi:hypothetical protein